MPFKFNFGRFEQNLKAGIAMIPAGYSEFETISAKFLSQQAGAGQSETEKKESRRLRHG